MSETYKMDIGKSECPNCKQKFKGVTVDIPKGTAVRDFFAENKVLCPNCGIEGKVYV